MQLHYTESGKGSTTLVFLHYFGGASSTWDEVIKYLQDDFRCIAVDLLGFGDSPAPIREPLTVNDSADSVLQLTRSLYLQQYILVGHSMGGKIALDIAVNQPEGLQKLILIAPSPPTPEPMSDDERKEMTDAFEKQDAIQKMISSVTAKPLDDPIFKREVRNNLKASRDAWNSWPQHGSLEDISRKMKNIIVPVSIISGGADKKFTEDFLQTEFCKYFQNTDVTKIANSGHLLPVEAPEQVANMIKDLSM